MYSIEEKINNNNLTLEQLILHLIVANDIDSLKEL